MNAMDEHDRTDAEREAAESLQRLREAETEAEKTLEQAEEELAEAEEHAPQRPSRDGD
jgi:hypothetical protein